MIEPGTREALEASIVARCHEAKRCFPVVGTNAQPSEWDESHALIDLLLGRWVEMVRG